MTTQLQEIPLTGEGMQPTEGQAAAATARPSMLAELFAVVRPKKSAKEDVPAYLEVMGEAFSEVAFLRHVTAILAGIDVLLMIVLLKVGTRPPLVIRVDDVRGAAAVRDLQMGTAATGAEVRNFSEHFTRDLMGWDFYTLDDDINRAFAMMTPEAAIKVKRDFDKRNLTAQVRTDSLRTKVTVVQITVEKDTAHAVVVKVRGSRVSESYEKKDYRHETMFEDTLVVRKVARTETTPWGLLVEDWNESVFKETTTP